MACQWELIATDSCGDSPQPCPRTYFSMVAYRRKLWLFGGFGDSKGRFNDLRTYDVDTTEWSVITTSGESPKPIYLHSAVIYNDRMYVFGGSIGKDSNDLYIFNFSSSTWQKAVTSPNAPSPRYGHAATVINDHMIIVGGCKQNSVYHQDAYSYSFSSDSWRRLGDVPLDVAYHSLSRVGESVYLYGGFNGSKFASGVHELDLNSGKWSPLKTHGQIPPPSCGAALATTNNYIYVFGGYTASGHTNDLYRLDIGSPCMWSKIDVIGKPVTRAYLQSAIIDNTLYIFGGYNGSQCITDFRRLRLPDNNVNMAKVLFERDTATQVTIALKHFSSKIPGLLDSHELGLLLRNISMNLASLNLGSGPDHAHLHTNKSLNSLSSAPRYEMSLVRDLIDMGFSRDHVIDCLESMVKHGQDVNNLQLVADKCLNHVMTKPSSSSASMPSFLPVNENGSPTSPSVSHQSKDDADASLCKICFESIMDCVLLPCGHLCLCIKCADGIKDCVICRKPKTGHFKIYWT